MCGEVALVQENRHSNLTFEVEGIEQKGERVADEF